MDYVNKLIDHYVSKKISKEKLIELHDNPIFMADLILKTDNIEYYKKASLKVITDETFIKQIIKYKKENKTFICEIIDNYIHYTEQHKTNKSSNSFLDLSKNKIEIIIIANNIMNNELNHQRIDYSINAGLIYMDFKKIYHEIRKNKPKEYLRNIGEGFIIVNSKFHGNKIINDYFAKMILFDIVSKREYNRNLLNLKDNLRELSKFDMNLKEYIISDINLLNFYKKILKNKDEIYYVEDSSNLIQVDFVKRKKKQ